MIIPAYVLIMEYICRDKYITMIKRILENRILRALEHFPAVAILGPRQAGKTTLAKMILSHLKKKSIFIDLENPEDAVMLSEPLRFFEANKEKCVIIDEIQRKPELFPLLRSVIDQDRTPARFILTGSASAELLFMSSETLTGRIVYTELTPFLFCEIETGTTLYNHWLWGGFPQPCLVEDSSFRTEWFRSFFVTYVERDFRIIGLGALPENLSRFFRMVAHIHGNIMNKNMLANSLALNQATINTYLNYFEQAFLIRVLPAWHINQGKRLIKSPKVYIRDSGLLHYLHRINDYNQLLGHPLLGHSWEGYVIEQIIGCKGDSYEYFFYRTQDGAECDLVLTRGNVPFFALEIKFTSTPSRSKGFTTAIADLGTIHNFIIIPEVKQTYSLGDNIMVCDLKKLLEMMNN
jgi:uncharacterized protein